MKKLMTILMAGLFAFAISSAYADGFNVGNKAPDGYKQINKNLPKGPAGLCLSCSTPNNEADIPDNGEDVTNGGCNTIPERYTDVTLEQTLCGRINGYLVGASPYRDIDWYRLTLTQPTTVYFSMYHNFNSYGLFLIAGADCINFLIYAGDYPYPGIPMTIFAALPAGSYFLPVTMNDYGPGYGGDYMIKISETAPGDPSTWCAAAIPTLSQWGLIILGCVLLGFGTFYIVRMRG
jgi:hypothetical protein